MLNIALTNLGKYNEGFLVYKWLSLPATDEEIKNTLKEIGIGPEYEEYFISDYETDTGLEIGEYDNLEELNEKAARLEELTETEKEIITALLSDGFTFDDALDKLDDVIYYDDCHDMADVARYETEELGIHEIPEWLANYIDYEAMGRDMSYEGHFIGTENGYIHILY